MQHILESLFLDTALPFRVRLFNILAIVGVLISVMNGYFFLYEQWKSGVVIYQWGDSGLIFFTFILCI